MAKSTGEKTGKGGSKKSLGGATDKLAELAQNPMARSMLAAGLVTAAAALTANQKVRQSAKKAGREAMDGAEAAADNASKVGAAIITAATDAVRRFMATATRSEASPGKSGGSKKASAGKAKAKPGPKKAGSGKAKAKAAAATSARKTATAKPRAAAAGAAAASAKPRAKAKPSPANGRRKTSGALPRKGPAATP